MKKINKTPSTYCIYKKFEAKDSGKLNFGSHYLAYSARGSMRLEIESRYFFLQPTKAVWIPADTEVIVDIPSSITCCSILFDPIVFPDHNQQILTIDMTPMTKHMILHCQRWSSDEVSNDENAQGFFYALANVIFERMASPTSDWIPRGKTSMVSRAVDLTMERYMNKLEVVEIASELATTERTLSRRIVDETGMKWGDLLRRIRVVRARELLASSDLQITRIGAEVGYLSQSAFNRAFKEESGFTPREFKAYCRTV